LINILVDTQHIHSLIFLHRLMDPLNKAKTVVSENPTIALIIIVVLLVVLVANYFNFNPWRKVAIVAKKEEEKKDEINDLIDSINSKQDAKP